MISFMRKHARYEIVCVDQLDSRAICINYVITVWLPSTPFYYTLILVSDIPNLFREHPDVRSRHCIDENK